eukprot:scaffold138969_cov18-Tisochrysis_lutea.AAC.1
MFDLPKRFVGCSGFGFGALGGFEHEGWVARAGAGRPLTQPPNPVVQLAQTILTWAADGPRPSDLVVQLVLPNVITEPRPSYLVGQLVLPSA